MSYKHGRTCVCASFVIYFISKNILIKCNTYDKVREEVKNIPNTLLKLFNQCNTESYKNIQPTKSYLRFKLTDFFYIINNVITIIVI